MTAEPSLPWTAILGVRVWSEQNSGLVQRPYVVVSLNKVHRRLFPSRYKSLVPLNAARKASKTNEAHEHVLVIK